MYYHNISWHIQTANSCFLDCAYCMTAESNKREIIASIDNVKHALRASLGFHKVYMVFLGGEPLMAGKDWFKEAFEITNNHTVKVQTRIFTNGHLLDDEWSELFKANKCQVVFSYDGLGNGAKGSKRSLKQLTKYSDLVTYATMTLTPSNYTGLIECYKEVSQAGVKRFALQCDIYATAEQTKLMAAEVCKLFRYIEDNPHGAKFSTYADIKSVMVGGKVVSNEFEPTVINNDWTVNADGVITLGVPDALDGEWNFGYIAELEHVNDLVFSPRMKAINDDHIASLNYMGDLERVNQLTHGGGFHFDKKGIMPMDKPNFPKLHFYKTLMDYFGG